MLEAVPCRGLARSAALLTLIAGGCGSSEQAAPVVDPVYELSADPAAALTGEVVTLRPVFTSGSAVVEGLGSVRSGESYRVGPLASTTTYRLVVTLGAATVTREVTVPLRYRERLSTTSPGDARSRHGATVLADGRVLVVGGNSPGAVFWDTAELFDPDTAAFTPAGSLSTSRTDSVVVALPDGGAYTLGGDINENSFEAVTRVEKWDAASNGWSTAGHLVCHRVRHTATLLDDGRVLVAGGLASGGTPTQRDAELWDEVTGSRQPAGEMLRRRIAHTATRLPDGRVLLAGGYSPATGYGEPLAEIYDPATETFAEAGLLNEPRAYHAAVLLSDGRVLVAGGDVFDGGIRGSAEIWDPVTGQFTRTGDLTVPRTELDAVLLGSGDVLVAGGLFDATMATSVLEIWSPASGLFRPLDAQLPEPRAGLSAHVLADARVLLVGGDPGSGFPAASASVFD